MNREPRGPDVLEAQGADLAGEAVEWMTRRGAGRAGSTTTHGQTALAGRALMNRSGQARASAAERRASQRVSNA